jgi:hypothetical protein
MVNWNTLIVPIITSIIGAILSGSALFSFIISGLYKPDMGIEVTPSIDGHNAKISIVNKGNAPAKNLILTVRAPYNIYTHPIVFSTENYTDKYNQSSNSYELYVQRFVQGDGSSTSISVQTDPKLNMSSKNYYSAYITYDQGSIRYVVPAVQQKPIPKTEYLNMYGNSIYLLAAGIISGISGLIYSIVVHKISKTKRLDRMEKRIDKAIDLSNRDKVESLRLLKELRTEIINQTKSGEINESDYERLDQKISDYINRMTPVIITTSPNDGATGVSVHTPIIAKFNMPMNAATINQNTFSLQDMNRKIVTAIYTLSPDRTTATLLPTPPLDSNTTYIAVVNTEAKDLAGVPLRSSKNWMFTTVSVSSL